MVIKTIVTKGNVREYNLIQLISSEKLKNDNNNKQAKYINQQAMN